MTDTPEREPEQRLPATRPPAVPAPVERFSSPPSVRTFELSPERAAQIVRQSSNARWVGFLATIVVILFVALYWFYELGAPLGITEARLSQEIDAQQVTKVERGYNIFEANCARCHGEQGEGGIGPVLNRQDKLFQHLNEAYLRNVLLVGGRFVCGNAASTMPVWSDQGNPPGPLNYRSIDELVAFLRATSDHEYIIRDHELYTPKLDPITGEVMTFRGWRDKDWTPEPGATPYPACWTDEFTSPSASPGASGSPGASASPQPSASGGTGSTTIDIVASGIKFTATEVTVPADTAFTIHFDNQDAGVPHDVAINDASGAQIFKGETFPGVATRDYQVQALAAGSYPFVCTVHANMTGTLIAQ